MNVFDSVYKILCYRDSCFIGFDVYLDRRIFLYIGECIEYWFVNEWGYMEF